MDDFLVTANQDFEHRRKKQVAHHKDHQVCNMSLKDFENIRNARILGSGSFGNVVLTKHKATNEYYAMKIYDKKHIVQEQEKTHVMEEKQLLSALDFPYLVRLHWSFQDKEKLYLVLDFMQGGDLFTHLQNVHRRGNHLPEREVRVYACQLVLALRYLHHLCIAYRDLKTENVLIDAHGFLKLADFGLAKRIRSKSGRTYTFCGTRSHMAPELLRDRHEPLTCYRQCGTKGTEVRTSWRRYGHGIKVDIWALGVVIYEMVELEPPFMEENKMELERLICSGKPRYSRRFSQILKDLLGHLIEVDPDKRYSAEQVSNDRWFLGANWKNYLHKKDIAVPFVPFKTPQPGNTRYFDSVENRLWRDVTDLNVELTEDDFKGIEFSRDC